MFLGHLNTSKRPINMLFALYVSVLGLCTILGKPGVGHRLVLAQSWAGFLGSRVSEGPAQALC